MRRLRLRIRRRLRLIILLLLVVVLAVAHMLIQTPMLLVAALVDIEPLLGHRAALPAHLKAH
jgi:hypothetical protein